MKYLDWILAIGMVTAISVTGWVMYSTQPNPDAKITMRVTPLPDGSLSVEARNWEFTHCTSNSKKCGRLE